MKHIVGLACAVFGLALLEAPLAAQDAALASPAAAQLPPPPPFPPMPSSRPSHRTVNLGGHHASRSHAVKSSARKARTATHHASLTKHRAETSKRVRSSKGGHSSKRAVHRSANRDKPLHFSKTTIRQCHAMTYRQIMGHSSCRALMKQELAAAPAKHRTSHKASAKHKAATRSKASRSHSTAKKRRR